jgi:hypothetical protein
LNPILLVIIAAVVLGIAIWFRYYVSSGGESANLFQAWLISGALAAACAAASFWIKDPTISRSFYMGYRILLSISIFIQFAFARSFSRKADYTLFFWSVPLMFEIAQVIVNGDEMYRVMGNSYVPDFANPFSVIQITIAVFYTLMALYYLVMLYIDLGKAGKSRQMRQVLLFIAAFATMLFFMLLESQTRSWLDVNIPIGGIGIIVGAVIIVLALRGPFMESAGET